MATLTGSRPRDLVSMETLLQHIPALEERTLRYWMSSNPDNFRERCMVIVGRGRLFLTSPRLKRGCG